MATIVDHCSNLVNLTCSECPNDIRTAFIPCGCAGMCIACSEELHREDRLDKDFCPFCDRRIEQVIRIRVFPGTEIIPGETVSTV